MEILYTETDKTLTTNQQLVTMDIGYDF